MNIFISRMCPSIFRYQVKFCDKRFGGSSQYGELIQGVQNTKLVKFGYFIDLYLTGLFSTGPMDKIKTILNHFNRPYGQKFSSGCKI